jgi:hypothetical protein
MSEPPQYGEPQYGSRVRAAQYGQPQYGQPQSGSGAPGGPPGYGYGYGYPPARRTDDTAVWALILAIGAYVICPVVPAIVALVLCSSAERNIAASGGTLGGDGLVKAARILSWIHLALAALAVVGFLIAVLTLGASFSLLP